MALYTICLDYRGGTYVSQIRGTKSCSVMIEREQQITDATLRLWNMDRTQLVDLASDEWIALEGLRNVFCSSAGSLEYFALLTIVVTLDS